MLAGQHAFPGEHHLGGVGLKGGRRHPLYQGLPLGLARDILALPGAFLQWGQGGFRLQGVEGGLGRLQFGIQIAVGQPEVEAEADTLSPAHQLDARQHEAAGAESLPAGLGRIERQAAVVAGAVFTV
ncbi:hypothetical protein D3C80_505500 [compost metagenome]